MNLPRCGGAILWTSIVRLQSQKADLKTGLHTTYSIGVTRIPTYVSICSEFIPLLDVSAPGPPNRMLLFCVRAFNYPIGTTCAVRSAAAGNLSSCRGGTSLSGEIRLISEQDHHFFPVLPLSVPHVRFRLFAPHASVFGFLPAPTPCCCCVLEEAMAALFPAALLRPAPLAI
jgi:hypothetical protein